MRKLEGNSLLEIVLVLAVSGVLIVLAIRYFTVVDLNARVAAAISKIDIISRASYEWLLPAHQKDFSEIKVEDLMRRALVSKDDIKSPWGGVIQVSSGEDKFHVRITLRHIPVTACHSLRRHLDAIAYSEISSAQCAGGNYYGEF